MELGPVTSSLSSTSSHKRKYHDALQPSQPPQPSASTLTEPLHPVRYASPPALSPPPPPHQHTSLHAVAAVASLASTSALASASASGPSASLGAQKAYIARTAPHLLDRPPPPALSRTPSLPPSGRSSPTSEDDHSASGHRHSSATPSSSKDVSTLHKTPEGYRGPVPLKNDSEALVPAPQLVAAPGSSTLFNTVNFPVNRNQWRYTGAGPATQHLPTTVYRTLQVMPDSIHWCWSDRSAFSKLSRDATVFSTDKGFRSGRTNVGVRQGAWYAEIEILAPEQPVMGAGGPGPMAHPMRDGPHVRLGWGRREAPLNAPAGFDGYSYAYRDKTGDKVTLSRPRPYGRSFQAGDVVGLYIKLPPEREPEDEWDPARIRRERIPIRYKGQLYFEALEYGRSREMEQLMDRSRKGMSAEDAIASLESAASGETSLRDANGAGAPAGSSSAAAGGGSAKVKNKSRTKTSGSASAGKGKSAAPNKRTQLRPLPSLKGSKIGFFVNGEAQGVAFTDLFDYRPLRIKSAEPAGGTGGGNDRAGGVGSRSEAASTASSKPTIRNRENIFDDGALGYFPFVSCYGNARARLVTGEAGFRFPPPADIEAALDEADRRKTSFNATAPAAPPPSLSLTSRQLEGEGLEDVKMEDAATASASASAMPAWRPLWERYAEHIEEEWRHDLADEERAQQAAAAAAAAAAETTTRHTKPTNSGKTSKPASKRTSQSASASPAPRSIQTPTPPPQPGAGLQAIKQDPETASLRSLSSTPVPPEQNTQYSDEISAQLELIFQAAKEEEWEDG
ncbi:transcription factor, contains a PHD finger motif [Thecaphora frezii]